MPKRMRLEPAIYDDPLFCFDGYAADEADRDVRELLAWFEDEVEERTIALERGDDPSSGCDLIEEAMRRWHGKGEDDA